LAGEPVTGTLLATPASADVLPSLRALADTLPSGSLGAATIIDDVVVCRYLGPSAGEARALFAAMWGVLRPRLLGRAACAPRIWAT
jgi:urease accessory protein